MSMERIPVLCIGAIGQSGSTLLARMLGQVPGLVAVGETGRVWDKGLVEDMACGCGEPFRACPFWTAVGEEAFGGWDRVDTAEATRLRDGLTLRGRAPHALALPLILRPSLSRRYGADLRRYQALMGRLYVGIHRASGGRVIVDSMKQPAHVYMVSRMPEVDLRVVHLVRDSRGVAYSKTKWVHRQGARSDEFRVRRPPPKSGEKWIWMNLSFDALAGLGVPTSRLRYEELVRSPKGALLRVLSELGIERRVDDLGFIGEGWVELPTDHLAAGSRMRLEAGRLPLREDDAWRHRLSPTHRRVVTALTWPLLVRYGYRGSP
ncbi:MAG: sulfotransferase [Actinomycetota bacterium]|jgi:hypothetical protein|nr:MAG: sulfotransferase [Actinomycetota bacterium]